MDNSKSASDTYVMTLDPNGGFIEIGGKYDLHPYVKTVTFNQPIGGIPSPVRVGYAFKGWLKRKDWTFHGADESSSYISVISDSTWKWRKDLVFTAKWDPKVCQVTWDYDYGEGYAQPNPITESMAFGQVLGNTHFGTNAPTRYGCKFLGWFTHPTYGVQVDPYSIVEDVHLQGSQFAKTYYARWELDDNAYFATKVFGDDQKEIEIFLWDKWKSIPPPTPIEGKRFVGWTVTGYDKTTAIASIVSGIAIKPPTEGDGNWVIPADPNYGNRVSFKNLVKPTQTVTLTAMWEDDTEQQEDEES